MNTVTTGGTNVLQQKTHIQALAQAQRIGAGVALLIAKKPSSPYKIN